LSLFLPFVVRTADVSRSLLVAGPLLFISICTFIANDLNDHQRDEVNHPERPLPSGHITPSFAAALYFVFLTAALLTTRYCVRENIAFWYYFLMALSISYGHIVEHLPVLKAPYVAAVIAIPVLILASSFHDANLHVIAIAVFLFNTGKELCMDVIDRPGDVPSPIHRILARHITLAAACLQMISVALLVILSVSGTRQLTALFLSVMIVLQGSSAYYLLVRDNLRYATHLMRAQLVLGFYFIAAPSY
jgi:geranylgeranylglycerol-phosphate geranylgeranyltransferase